MSDAEASRANPERGRFLVEAAVFVVLGLIGAGVWLAFARDARRPNVILISIDTLRPDHLGCYGYPKPTSPNIDALARRGVLFGNAHSTTTWTLPAHLALMTGLPDQLHEVRHDLIGIDDRRRMLAECFQKAGYDTAGFYGGPYLSPEFGFRRGFRVYKNCGAPTTQELKEMLPPDQRAHAALQAEAQSHRVRTAETIEARVEEYLQETGDEPFFLFIHHWDVHYDFNPPESYVRMFAPDYRGRLDPSQFIRNPAIHPGMDPADLEWVIAHYDGEIRYVDTQIGRLLAKLEELGLDDDTYVIVTADHGEEFFEHGNKGHRYNLHEETLRIPLIVAGPGVRPGHRVERQARIFDVMPTVLELAGLEPERECFGVSLAPFLKGGDPPNLRELPVIAELTYIPKVEDPESPQGFRSADHYFHHEAFARDLRKLIEVRTRAFDERRPAQLNTDVREQTRLLYDLRRDPGERDDLAGEDPQLLERMVELGKRIAAGLKAWHDTLPSARNPDARVRQYSDDVLEQLKQVGYIDPAAAPPAHHSGK